jgi:hypothetical protein
MKNNALWIHERAVELQLRLRVEAHCHSAGHRAYERRLAQSIIMHLPAWTYKENDRATQDCDRVRADPAALSGTMFSWNGMAIRKNLDGVAMFLATTSPPTSTIATYLTSGDSASSSRGVLLDTDTALFALTLVSEPPYVISSTLTPSPRENPLNAFANKLSWGGERRHLPLRIIIRLVRRRRRTHPVRSWQAMRCVFQRERDQRVPKGVAATLRLQLSLSCGFYPRTLSLVLLDEGPHALSSWECRFASSLLPRHTEPSRRRSAAPAFSRAIIVIYWVIIMNFTI